MEDPSPLRRIYFGRVEVAPAILALRGRLDDSLHQVCAGLPPPLPVAVAAMLSGYSRRAADSPTAAPSFFRHFYSPLWSWIHWAADAADDDAVVSGQAMAMFLHLFDDHLCDGDLACTPARLQLRTVAWQRLAQCAQDLSAGDAAAQALWRDDQARYFAAVEQPPIVTDLDAYCARFRDQMATCAVLPALALQRRGDPDAAADLRAVVFGLGVAWRLIDDVQDAFSDWRHGHASIFEVLLRHAGQADLWPGPAADAEALQRWAPVVELLLRRGLLKSVLGRCTGELRAAAERAEARGWTGLASELRQLCAPVSDVCGKLP